MPVDLRDIMEVEHDLSNPTPDIDCSKLDDAYRYAMKLSGAEADTSA